MDYKPVSLVKSFLHLNFIKSEYELVFQKKEVSAYVVNLYFGR